MKKAFPEVFVDLKKCPDSCGKFYLMTRLDWHNVLQLLDKKKWALNYDRYVLNHEEEIHTNTIKTTEKELCEAMYCKGVNPQDDDQAYIFGFKRLDEIDQMDMHIQSSNIKAQCYIEKE